MKFLLLAATVALIAAPAQAYYSTMATGDIVERDHHRLTLETQFITDREGGVNLLGRLDRGINDSLEMRGLLGFGYTDFQIGGFVKWIPYPDFENQPAIGALAGVQFARHDGENELSLRFHPLISKHYYTEVGDFTPYFAIPFGLRSVSSHYDVPIQVELGTLFKSPNLEDLRFMGEIGFNVDNAFTYLSFGITMNMDEEFGM